MVWLAKSKTGRTPLFTVMLQRISIPKIGAALLNREHLVNKNRWSLEKYADGQQNDQSQPLPIYRQFAPSLAGCASTRSGGGGGGGVSVRNITADAGRLSLKQRIFQNPAQNIAPNLYSAIHAGFCTRRAVENVQRRNTVQGFAWMTIRINGRLRSSHANRPYFATSPRKP